jgi:hypothetical protein
MIGNNSIVIVSFKGIDFVIPLEEHTKEEARITIAGVIGKKDIRHASLSFYGAKDKPAYSDEIRICENIRDFRFEFNREFGVKNLDLYN